MRPRIHAVASPSEIGDFSAEVRQVFMELGRAFGSESRRARRESSFHLVERGYGRFARGVRLGRACDTSKARATLANGALRVSIPKIADRRNRAIPIAIG